MLSITRSGLSSLAQFSFLGLNAIGLILGAIYSNKTPNLYANNSHSKIGWISACIAVVQTIMVLMGSFGDRDEEKRTVTPISVGNMAQNNTRRGRDSPRYSQEFEQDDDPVSSRNNSISGTTDCEEDFSHRMQDHQDTEWDVDLMEKRSLLGNNAGTRVLSRIPLKLSQRTMHRAIKIVRGLVDYTILLLGFLAITTGAVVYGGIFVSPFVNRLPQMAR